MSELQTMPLRFRVWDKESKKFLTNQHGNTHFANLYWLGNFMCHETEEEEYDISQDTGMKDKNDKSIFIFDIVKDKHGRLYEVLYVYGGVYAIHNSRKVGLDEETLYRKIYHEGGVEIVGNLFQNPELLEA